MSITPTLSSGAIVSLVDYIIRPFYIDQTFRIAPELSQLVIESIVFCTYISANILHNALIDKT